MSSRRLLKRLGLVAALVGVTGPWAGCYCAMVNNSEQGDQHRDICLHRTTARGKVADMGAGSLIDHVICVMQTDQSDVCTFRTIFKHRVGHRIEPAKQSLPIGECGDKTLRMVHPLSSEKCPKPAPTLS